MRLGRRTIAVALAVGAWALGGLRVAHAQDAFEIALLDGWARAITEHGAHWITEASPALELAGGAYLELGPDCRLEVVDAGRGSFVLAGTASAELTRTPEGVTRLALRRFDRLEVHTMRGAFDVVLPAGQRLRLGHAVTHLSGSPDGSCRLQHLLGDPIELDIGGWYTFDLAVGTRRAVPPRIDASPAPRRSVDFVALRQRRRALEPTPTHTPQVTNEGVRLRGGLDDRIRTTLFGFRTTTAREWSRFQRWESGAPR